jgi:hypothetical protein
MSQKVSILVLDYSKPAESKLLLNSIKQGCQFDYELIYLSNGGEQSYVFDYYKEGLIDKLILNKKNNGCGNGTVQLFDACETDYAFYIQNDQILNTYITQKHIEDFIGILNNRYYNYRCIDLAGAQAGKNKYSERAHFIDVNFYKSIYKGEKGQFAGPGPYNHKKYVEQHIQEYFEKNRCQVYHTIPMFIDNGKWSIREIGDGLYKHRADTKQLYILKKPSYITEVYPPFDKELEWPKVLAGEWVDGDIPIAWQKHSFKCWE